MEVQDQQEATLIQRVGDAVSETSEYLASFSIGQAILKQTDRALWVLEKCAEWSVPNQPQQKHYQQNGTFGKSGPLIRPLPWILFLPMLIFMRLLRISLNISALLFGFESVQPITMVKFIQVRRRKVRALKFLGLRKIRQRTSPKEHSKSDMGLRDRFYNIMSRAMCFRVTNTDMDEEITLKKEDEVQSSSNPGQTANTTRERNVSGQDFKRKYIEILKNNYCDMDDVEDDEELIDRITILAEDYAEDEDADYMPAEDSATEDDSMSDPEEDALSSTVVASESSPKQIKRLSSHGSIANEVIEEENEETETSTFSGNSEDESTQQIEKGETTIKPEDESKKVEILDMGTISTSDEFYSPDNSIPTSPEPKIDDQNNTQKTKTDAKNELINLESKVKTQNSYRPITAREKTPNGANNSNGVNSRVKKHKHRRRLSNFLRKKRK